MTLLILKFVWTMGTLSNAKNLAFLLNHASIPETTHESPNWTHSTQNQDHVFY